MEVFQQLIENTKIVLSNEDRDLFLSTLKNPPAPNEALQNALQDFTPTPPINTPHPR